MVGIYFSGTGNSRYYVKKFLEEYEPQAEAFSLENENAGAGNRASGRDCSGLPGTNSAAYLRF